MSIKGKLYKITVQLWELKRHVICLDTTRSQNSSPHERKQPNEEYRFKFNVLLLLRGIF